MPLEDEVEKLVTQMTTLSETVKTMAEQSSSFTKVIAQQGQSQLQLGETLKTITASLSDGIKITPQPKDEELDFSAMDQVGLVKHLITEINKTQTESEERSKKGLLELNDKIDRSGRQAELTKTMEAEGNEDFEDFLPEMKVLAEKGQGLSVNQLLKLARAENPTKTAELAEKYHKEEPKKDEEIPFLGLTPTSDSTVTLVDTKGDDGKMDLKDGLLKAWEDVIPKSMNKAMAEEDSLF